MPAILSLFLDGDPFAGYDLGSVLSGDEGAPVVLEVRNVGDAQARSNRLRILERASALVAFGTSGPASSGSWIQARRMAGTGGLTVPVSSLTRIGAARYLELPAMEPGEGVEVEFSLAVPGGRLTSAGELAIEVSWNELAVPLPAGSHPQGILTRYRDSDATYLIDGGELTAGVAEVDVAEVIGCVAGVPTLALAETLPADDEAADGPLGVGEGYWMTVTLDSDGLVGTKGDGAALPLDPLDRPAGPGVLLGWAEVAQDGTVTVFDGRQPARFDLIDDADLTPDLGRGSAIAGSGLVLRDDVQDPVTLPAAATDARIVLLPSGLAEVVPAGGTAAHPEPLTLYQVTTDADSITAAVDMRRWSGAVTISVPIALADESVQGIEVPPGEWGLVEPLRFTVAKPSAGTGQSVLDLEFWDGAAWVSAFAGDTARRPTIAAGDAEAEAWPEVLVMQGGERWRARINEATAGGLPEGGAIRLVLA